MEKEIKAIRIEDLEPGMFVEDVFNAQGVLLLSANSVVQDPDQIEKLRRQGVASLYINVRKGKDLPAEKREAPAVPAQVKAVAYFKELDKAREIYQSTLETARETLMTLKKGTDVPMRKVEIAAADIVTSLMRNPDAIVSLVQIKGHDEYTFTHSVHVGVLTASLAQALGYKGERLLQAAVGGVLHDIGKMKIPDSILNKPGKYFDWEFNVMKKHPEHGFEIVKDKHDIPELAKTAIMQHHERFSGNGYPKGLSGDQIEEIGLICAVADVYDAMTSDRVYRPAWTPQKALGLIFQGCDVEFSRIIVEHFAKHLGIYPVGSFVRLVSGEMGIVTRVEKGSLLCPEVLVLFDRAGARMETPCVYDLKEMQARADGALFKIEMSLNPKAFRIDVGEYLGKGMM